MKPYLKGICQKYLPLENSGRLMLGYFKISFVSSEELSSVELLILISLLFFSAVFLPSEQILELHIFYDSNSIYL